MFSMLLPCSWLSKTIRPDIYYAIISVKFESAAISIVNVLVSRLKLGFFILENVAAPVGFDPQSFRHASNAKVLLVVALGKRFTYVPVYGTRKPEPVTDTS